jgi:hypothetical protein
MEIASTALLGGAWIASILSEDTGFLNTVAVSN